MDNYIFGFLAIVGLVFGFVAMFRAAFKNNKKPQATQNNDAKPSTDEEQQEQDEPIIGNVAYPYTLNRRIFSPKEGYFYRDVRPIADKLGLIVFTKIRLADLLTVPKGTKDYTKWFNRIKAKHVDFVFVDREYNIKLLVEVDDPTHNRPDRQARDEAVDEMFRQVGMEVLHLRAWGKQYGAEDLETIITNALNVQKISSGK